MSYIRYFLTLICEADGYGCNGKKPSGSCVLEARGGEGKLTCFAQNLKPEMIYPVCLLFPDGARFAGMPAGKLMAEPGGKAQARFTFLADGILDGRFQLEACMGVAVLAGQAADITAVLCGYRGTQVNWKRGFYDGAVKNAEVKALVAPESPTEAIFAAEEFVATMIGNAIEITPRPMEEILNLAEALPAPKPEPIEETPVLIHIPIEEISAPTFEQVVEIPMSTEEVTMETAGQGNKPVPLPQRDITAILDELFTNHLPEHPFQKQNRNAKWVKTTLDENIPPPINAPNLFREGFVTAAYKEHGHFLVGVTEKAARSQLIFGVPGHYDIAARPTANALGFTQFKPVEDVRVTRGQFGYWLMFINL